MHPPLYYTMHLLLESGYKKLSSNTSTIKNGENEHYYTIKLVDATLVKFETTFDEAASYPIEALDMTYRKIIWTHEISGTSKSDDWTNPLDPDSEPSNNPPFTTANEYTINTNSTLTSTLNATDADNDTLHYEIISSPTKGATTIDNATTGKFTYSPNIKVRGTDKFTFQVNDGKANSNESTISININAPPPSDQEGNKDGAGNFSLIDLFILFFFTLLLQRKQIRTENTDGN